MKKLTKILAIILSLSLLLQQIGFAQVAGTLDISGFMTQLRQSIAVDKFRPLHLRYLAYDNINNNFKLLLDKGDLKNLKSAQLEETSKKLLNLFFVGVTLPNDSFWVNLRPDAPDKMIDPMVAMTDVGKVFCEADLQLKKDTAKFTSPDTPEGREYWNRLYEKAGQIFGSQNITIPTLTRPWIVPDEVIIRESTDNAYIYKATLKVMLEQDYLKDSSTYNFKDDRLKALNEYSSQLIRELIIPKLTKEINTSKRYAPLRQVYYSLIMAQWFKQKFRGKGGLYSWLIDQSKLNGLTSKEEWSKDYYFKEYQKSFQQGEYNFKEPVTTPFGQTIRSYFSGGIAVSEMMPQAKIVSSPTPIIGQDGIVAGLSYQHISSPINVTGGNVDNLNVTIAQVAESASSPAPAQNNKPGEESSKKVSRRDFLATVFTAVSGSALFPGVSLGVLERIVPAGEESDWILLDMIGYMPVYQPWRDAQGKSPLVGVVTTKSLLEAVLPKQQAHVLEVWLKDAAKEESRLRFARAKEEFGNRRPDANSDLFKDVVIQVASRYSDALHRAVYEARHGQPDSLSVQRLKELTGGSWEDFFKDKTVQKALQANCRDIDLQETIAKAQGWNYQRTRPQEQKTEQDIKQNKEESIKQEAGSITDKELVDEWQRYANEGGMGGFNPGERTVTPAASSPMQQITWSASEPLSVNTFAGPIYQRLYQSSQGRKVTGFAFRMPGGALKTLYLEGWNYDYGSNMPVSARQADGTVNITFTTQTDSAAGEKISEATVKFAPDGTYLSIPAVFASYNKGIIPNFEELLMPKSAASSPAKVQKARELMQQLRPSLRQELENPRSVIWLNTTSDVIYMGTEKIRDGLVNLRRGHYYSGLRLIAEGLFNFVFLGAYPEYASRYDSIYMMKGLRALIAPAILSGTLFGLGNLYENAYLNIAGTGPALGVLVYFYQRIFQESSLNHEKQHRYVQLLLLRLRNEGLIGDDLSQAHRLLGTDDGFPLFKLEKLDDASLREIEERILSKVVAVNAASSPVQNHWPKTIVLTALMAMPIFLGLHRLLSNPATPEPANVPPAILQQPAVTQIIPQEIAELEKTISEREDMVAYDAARGLVKMVQAGNPAALEALGRLLNDNIFSAYAAATQLTLGQEEVLIGLYIKAAAAGSEHGISELLRVAEFNGRSSAQRGIDQLAKSGNKYFFAHIANAEVLKLRNLHLDPRVRLPSAGVAAELHKNKYSANPLFLVSCFTSPENFTDLAGIILDDLGKQAERKGLDVLSFVKQSDVSGTMLKDFILSAAHFNRLHGLITESRSWSLRGIMDTVFNGMISPEGWEHYAARLGLFVEDMCADRAFSQEFQRNLFSMYNNAKGRQQEYLAALLVAEQIRFDKNYSSQIDAIRIKHNIPQPQTTIDFGKLLKNGELVSHILFMDSDAVPFLDAAKAFLLQKNQGYKEDATSTPERVVLRKGIIKVVLINATGSQQENFWESMGQASFISTRGHGGTLAKIIGSRIREAQLNSSGRILYPSECYSVTSMSLGAHMANVGVAQGAHSTLLTYVLLDELGKAVQRGDTTIDWRDITRNMQRRLNAIMRNIVTRGDSAAVFLDMVRAINARTPAASSPVASSPAQMSRRDFIHESLGLLAMLGITRNARGREAGFALENKVKNKIEDSIQKGIYAIPFDSIEEWGACLTLARGGIAFGLNFNPLEKRDEEEAVLNRPTEIIPVFPYEAIKTMPRGSSLVLYYRPFDEYAKGAILWHERMHALLNGRAGGVTGRGLLPGTEYAQVDALAGIIAKSGNQKARDLFARAIRTLQAYRSQDKSQEFFVYLLQALKYPELRDGRWSVIGEHLKKGSGEEKFFKSLIAQRSENYELFTILSEFSKEIEGADAEKFLDDYYRQLGVNLSAISAASSPAAASLTGFSWRKFVATGLLPILLSFSAVGQEATAQAPGQAAPAITVSQNAPHASFLFHKHISPWLFDNYLNVLYRGSNSDLAESLRSKPQEVIDYENELLGNSRKEIEVIKKALVERRTTGVGVENSPSGLKESTVNNKKLRELIAKRFKEIGFSEKEADNLFLIMAGPAEYLAATGEKINLVATETDQNKKEADELAAKLQQAELSLAQLSPESKGLIARINKNEGQPNRAIDQEIEITLKDNLQAQVLARTAVKLWQEFKASNEKRDRDLKGWLDKNREPIIIIRGQGHQQYIEQGQSKAAASSPVKQPSDNSSQNGPWARVLYSLGLAAAAVATPYIWNVVKNTLYSGRNTPDAHRIIMDAQKLLKEKHPSLERLDKMRDSLQEAIDNCDIVIHEIMVRGERTGLDKRSMQVAQRNLQKAQALMQELNVLTPVTVVIQKDTYEGRNNDLITLLTRVGIEKMLGLNLNEGEHLVLDIGVGAFPFTTIELYKGLRGANPKAKIKMIGTELPSAAASAHISSQALLSKFRGEVSKVLNETRGMQLNPEDVTDIRLIVDNKGEIIEALAGTGKPVTNGYVTFAVAPHVSYEDAKGNTDIDLFRQSSLFERMISFLSREDLHKIIKSGISQPAKGNIPDITIILDPVKEELQKNAIEYLIADEVNLLNAPAVKESGGATLVTLNNVMQHWSRERKEKFMNKIAPALLKEGGVLEIKTHSKIEIFRKENDKIVEHREFSDKIELRERFVDFIFNRLTEGLLQEDIKQIHLNSNTGEIVRFIYSLDIPEEEFGEKVREFLKGVIKDYVASKASSPTPAASIPATLEEVAGVKILVNGAKPGSLIRELAASIKASRVELKDKNITSINDIASLACSVMTSVLSHKIEELFPRASDVGAIGCEDLLKKNPDLNYPDNWKRVWGNEFLDHVLTYFKLNNYFVAVDLTAYDYTHGQADAEIFVFGSMDELKKALSMRYGGSDWTLYTIWSNEKIAKVLENVGPGSDSFEMHKDLDRLTAGIRVYFADHSIVLREDIARNIYSTLAFYIYEILKANQENPRHVLADKMAYAISQEKGLYAGLDYQKLESHFSALINLGRTILPAASSPTAAPRVYYEPIAGNMYQILVEDGTPNGTPVGKMEFENQLGSRQAVLYNIRIGKTGLHYGSALIATLAARATRDFPEAAHPFLIANVENPAIYEIASKALEPASMEVWTSDFYSGVPTLKWVPYGSEAFEAIVHGKTRISFAEDEKAYVRPFQLRGKAKVELVGSSPITDADLKLRLPLLTSAFKISGVTGDCSIEPTFLQENIPLNETREILFTSEASGKLREVLGTCRFEKIKQRNSVVFRIVGLTVQEGMQGRGIENLLAAKVSDISIWDNTPTQMGESINRGVVQIMPNALTRPVETVARQAVLRQMGFTPLLDVARSLPSGDREEDSLVWELDKASALNLINESKKVFLGRLKASSPASSPAAAEGTSAENINWHFDGQDRVIKPLKDIPKKDIKNILVWAADDFGMPKLGESIINTWPLVSALNNAYPNSTIYLATDYPDIFLANQFHGKIKIIPSSREAVEGSKSQANFTKDALSWKVDLPAREKVLNDNQITMIFEINQVPRQFSKLAKEGRRIFGIRNATSYASALGPVFIRGEAGIYMNFIDRTGKAYRISGDQEIVDEIAPRGSFGKSGIWELSMAICRALGLDVNVDNLPTVKLTAHERNNGLQVLSSTFSSGQGKSIRLDPKKKIVVVNVYSQTQSLEDNLWIDLITALMRNTQNAYFVFTHGGAMDADFMYADRLLGKIRENLGNEPNGNEILIPRANIYPYIGAILQVAYAALTLDTGFGHLSNGAFNVPTAIVTSENIDHWFTPRRNAFPIYGLSEMSGIYSPAVYEARRKLLLEGITEFARLINTGAVASSPAPQGSLVSVSQGDLFAQNIFYKALYMNIGDAWERMRLSRNYSSDTDWYRRLQSFAVDMERVSRGEDAQGLLKKWAPFVPWEKLKTDAAWQLVLEKIIHDASNLLRDADRGKIMSEQPRREPMPVSELLWESPHYIGKAQNILAYCAALKNFPIKATRYIANGWESIAIELEDGRVLKITNMDIELWLGDLNNPKVREFDAPIYGAGKSEVDNYPEATTYYYIQPMIDVKNVTDADVRDFEQMLSKKQLGGGKRYRDIDSSGENLGWLNENGRRRLVLIDPFAVSTYSASASSPAPASMSGISIPRETANAADQMGVKKGDKVLLMGYRYMKLPTALGMRGVKATLVDFNPDVIRMERLLAAPLNINDGQVPPDFINKYAEEISREDAPLDSFDIVSLLDLFIDTQGDPYATIRVVLQRVKDGGIVYLPDEISWRDAVSGIAKKEKTEKLVLNRLSAELGYSYEVIPGKFVQGDQTNQAYRINKHKTQSVASSPTEKGGIDLRALPITIQPIAQSRIPAPMVPNITAKPDKEWLEIQNMMASGITPSGERLKSYIEKCAETQDVNKILSCLADILRTEEDNVVMTDPGLIKFLTLLESGKNSQELKQELAKINFAPQEPELVE